MAARLGNVILWACVLIAAAWMVATVKDGSSLPHAAMLAAVVVLIGAAARYVLAGRASA
jgi:hypothetical protein